MAAQKIIRLTEYCKHHQIETTFIKELHDNDLIKLQYEKRTAYIPYSELSVLDRMVRMSRDLELNVPGILLVNQLLQRIKDHEQQIRELNSKLSLFDK